jgi:hypothetical protein
MTYSILSNLQNNFLKFFNQSSPKSFGSKRLDDLTSLFKDNFCSLKLTTIVDNSIDYLNIICMLK